MTKDVPEQPPPLVLCRVGSGGVEGTNHNAQLIRCA